MKGRTPQSTLLKIIKAYLMLSAAGAAAGGTLGMLYSLYNVKYLYYFGVIKGQSASKPGRVFDGVKESIYGIAGSTLFGAMVGGAPVTYPLLRIAGAIRQDDKERAVISNKQ